MKTGDNNIRSLGAVKNAPSLPKQTVRECWGAQDVAELYRVADHLTRLGFPVVVCTGWSDEGDPWAVFERQGTGDVVVHVARIDTVLVVVDVAQDRMYRGADFRAVADQLMADVVPIVQPPRDRGNVVMHPSMALTIFVGAALVAASLADPASADAPSDALPRPEPALFPGRDTPPHADGQDAGPASVIPLESLQVMQSRARASNPSEVTSAVVDSPVLPRFELSERLAGRDTFHGMSAALPYGGMGMGVGLITLSMHFATPQSDIPDDNEVCALPEENLLLWAIPSPDCNMQGLLSSPADATFDGSLNGPDRSVQSAGQGGGWAQAAEAVSLHPHGTTLPSMALPRAQTVDSAAPTVTYAMFIENAANRQTGPETSSTDVGAATPESSYNYNNVTQVVPIVSPARPMSVDAPDAVNAATSVVIFDHVVESIWTVDRIVLLGFNAEAPDAPDGLLGGAIVLQMRLDETDTHADSSPDVVPEGALTVAWPTAASDITADSDAPLIPLETYVLADTLSDLVTLQDDTANVLVYLGGSVNVLGFELGRDRIVMVEDAGDPDWLYSVDILGQDVVLTGLDGGSVTLFGAAATIL